MNIPFRSLFAATTLSLAFASSLPAAAAPGYFDFGKFTAAPDLKFVEVNVQAGLLKFAAKIAASHEPDAAELLRNIQHVRVNVVGMDDSNKADTLARMTSIRADLEAKGWEKIVTVHEPKASGSDDVAIFMKANEDTILGLVVTVIEHKGNAVFVNVVGNIQADQLAKLGEKLDIKPLNKLKIPAKAAKQS
jgi:hypothetical protein